ncbi:clumping factor B [Drosophila busckii]|uniref:clumping factor B n=1 Tax=Drosophila busckii TaxID=30019 RepID=UPI00083EC53B|nr:clumping factor B [Drosophila busckii]
MAFVARRNSEGKFVDCQPVAGCGIAVAELSDEEPASVASNYSDRSYITQTVRFVGKDEPEPEPQPEPEPEPEPAEMLDLDLDDDDDDDDANSSEGYDQLDTDLDSLADEQQLEDDYPDLNVNDLQSDVETLQCSRSYAEDEADLELDSELEQYTSVVSKQLSARVSHRSCKSNAASQRTLQLQLPAEDALSIGSTGSATVCHAMASLESLTNLSDFEEQDALSQVTSRTYNVKPSPGRRNSSASATASTCSWNDLYGGLKPSESRSNIVPSLSLNMSTASSSSSSTYFRSLNDEKAQAQAHGEAAYQEWMKRKRNQNAQKAQQAKQEREKREAENAVRQRLAKERYEQWVRQKEQTNKQKKPQQQQQQLGNDHKKGMSSTGSCASFASSGSWNPQSGVKLPHKEPPEVTKKRLQEWERIKSRQQQRERERQLKQQQSKQQEEQQRKQKSQGAWQNWMKSVGNRPKPVPLNQGFDSLRGTVSNIYINPVQWVSNIDPKDTRNN